MRSMSAQLLRHGCSGFALDGADIDLIVWITVSHIGGYEAVLEPMRGMVLANVGCPLNAYDEIGSCVLESRPYFPLCHALTQCFELCVTLFESLNLYRYLVAHASSSLHISSSDTCFISGSM